MTIRFVRQYLVAASSILAAVAVGSSVGYPSVLLQQLNSNDTSIILDWDTASWIGSIHGIAGIPSLIVPMFIQWKGRRLGFLFVCLINIVGWILAYTATSSTSLLISESFNGFGGQCISAANSFNMSEMLSPQIRKLALGLYLVLNTLGLAMVQITGNYLHWRTVSLIVCVPLIVTALTTLLWPESPSWLAYKGEFDKCEKAFTRLRGTGELAQVELEELILAQKENLSQNNRRKEQPVMEYLWQTVKRKDFYLPNIHIFILLLIVYWGGLMPHMIYTADIVKSATFTKDAIFLGSVAFNAVLFTSCVISTVLIKYFAPKKLLLAFVSCAVVFLLCASVVNYCQIVGWMSQESKVCLYLLIVYLFFMSLIVPIVLPITAELTPVKYRGFCGALQVIFPCVMHTTSLKSVPYMLLYFKLWGMLLIFAAVSIFCTLFTWVYIPETNGRTLQQLEDYYIYGNFDKCRRNEAEKCLTELISSGE